MSFDLIIRNGHIVRESGVERADIAIEDETIVEIAPSITGGAREEIDATDLHVFPGLIDPHVHFNEPGRTEWEGIATGSSALAAGGGTMFFDMPLNSSPPTLDGESFDLKLEAARAKSVTDFALWGGLTPTNLDNLEELAERGVVGFKAFMCESGIDDFLCADESVLARGMQIAAKLNLSVAVHAEDPVLIGALTTEVRARGGNSIEAYLASRPVEAETRAIESACKLAKDTGCSLHIVHVSSPEGLAHCLSAMLDNPKVTFETCPHYFCFSEDDLYAVGAALKCSPPLRSRERMERLRAMVNSGVVHFLGSDHSPAPASMKTDSNFFNIWGGVAGAQSTFLATIEHVASPTAVARLTSTNVARRFGIKAKGAIELGRDADLTLVDLARANTLSRDELLDRHKLSPYVGTKFRASVMRTILRGETIFLDGKIVGPARGRFVRPTPA